MPQLSKWICYCLGLVFRFDISFDLQRKKTRSSDKKNVNSSLKAQNSQIF